MTRVSQLMCTSSFLGGMKIYKALGYLVSVMIKMIGGQWHQLENIKLLLWYHENKLAIEKCFSLPHIMQMCFWSIGISNHKKYLTLRCMWLGYHIIKWLTI